MFLLRKVLPRRPGHTWALLTLFLGLSAAATAPAAARQTSPVPPGQITGTWRLALTGPGRAPVEGVARLLETRGDLTGTFAIATSDSAPVPLVGGRATSAGALTFRVVVDGQPVSFRGRLDGDSMIGDVVGLAPVVAWRGRRLPPGTEFYAALPRFRQRELILQDADSAILPGYWVAGATAAGWSDARIRAEYDSIAQAAGLLPLSRQQLAEDGLLHALGLYRRPQLRAAAVTALKRVRAGLANPEDQVRFNQLFHPDDGWLVDLHDVALERARMRLAGLDWDSLAPVLTAAGLVSAAVNDAVARAPLGLYRLRTLARRDTAAFAAARRRIAENQPGALPAVDAALDGYHQAEEWALAAVEFLATAKWLRTADGPTSPADLVRRVWQLPDEPFPTLIAYPFGYPEGVPRVAVPSGAAARLAQPENWSAQRWLERHGSDGLLDLLRLVDAGYDADLSLDVGPHTYEVTTAGRRAAASAEGFLEPHDAVLLDPGYMPVLALATVLHEWQHILHERARWNLPEPNGALTVRGEIALLHPANLLLAEGLAEWLTMQIVRPLAAASPLWLLGETEKRAALAGEHTDDPHVLGYLLMGALAEVLPAEPAAVRALVVRHGTDPTALAAEAGLARWRQTYGAAPDRPLVRRGRLAVIPFVRFTVEDRFPDVIERRLIAP